MILITMAGLSSRFFKAGYSEPKYKLPIKNETVFSLAIKSFDRYFSSEKFVFVLRDVFDAPKFVAEEIERLGIRDYEIVILEAETRGQAETAYIATKSLPGDFPIYIFNIDTFRYNYKKPSFVNDCDGYLEVFQAEGEHWSFVLPDGPEKVLKTTEKERISDLCSDGLYYFKSKLAFESLFEHAVTEEKTVRGEYYVAPLYNDLIARGGIVKYCIIGTGEIDFCGTPEEYSALIQTALR